MQMSSSYDISSSSSINDPYALRRTVIQNNKYAATPGGTGLHFLVDNYFCYMWNLLQNGGKKN